MQRMETAPDGNGLRPGNAARVFWTVGDRRKERTAKRYSGRWHTMAQTARYTVLRRQETALTENGKERMNG